MVQTAFKSPSYLVTSDHGYRFRIRVPAELEKVIGKRAIKFSLDTGRLGEAKIRARYLAGSESANKTEYRTVTIKTIDGSTIQGRVNISPNKRISDLLALQNRLFLVVVDARYLDCTGKTLFINKSHIVWIEPDD